MGNGIKGRIGKICCELMEWIFPSNIYCICCGCMIERDRAYALCDACMEDIHWIRGRNCEICGKALEDTFRGKRCYNCMTRPHKFLRGISCMTYGLKERQMILDLKYNGKGYMGIKFGDMLADKLASDPMLEEIDCIVPVPVHRDRERKRGYNQTAIMAARLGELTALPVRERGCCRTRATKLLRSMDPLEREAAMRGAFAVPEGERRHIRGKRVLVIDDIITTGATADAVAEALLEAGAQQVYLLTLAAGGNRRPGA